MNLLNQLRSNKTKATLTGTIYTVDVRTAPQLHALILEDELPLPLGIMVKLVTSDDEASLRLGDGVATWSGSIELGKLPNEAGA